MLIQQYWLHLKRRHDIVICFQTSVCRGWFTPSNFPLWTSFKGLAVLKWLLSAIPGWCTHILYNRSHQTASMWVGCRTDSEPHRDSQWCTGHYNICTKPYSRFHDIIYLRISKSLTRAEMADWVYVIQHWICYLQPMNAQFIPSLIHSSRGPIMHDTRQPIVQQ